MKMKKQLILITNVFILLVSILISISNATNDFNNNLLLVDDTTITKYEENNVKSRSLTYGDISGKEFFIKNMYTGQYLDVAGGIATNGTNVQQYKYNGTDAQRWYIRNNGDDTFSFYSRAGNDGTYKYALDISNASGENYANVQIWQINGTDAQKFQISQSVYSTFIFSTKASNFSKVIVLNGPTCNEGQNVDQYTFQTHANEMWILEPVGKYPILGVEYAKKNYNHYVMAYPNLNHFGDCANFASQCMLAGGMHYQNDWKVYRKNNNFPAPTTIDQLNDTWELCSPRTSPWISAVQFGRYWKSLQSNIVWLSFKGSYAYNNPEEIMSFNIAEGDVMQQAENILNNIGDSKHTMYITGYTTYDSKPSFVVTGHSSEQPGKPLLQICKENPDDFFIIFLTK